MALVIKKAVDLGSLGSEYTGISFVFKSIPAEDLGKLTNEQEKLGEDLDKQLSFFINILKNQFISGKQDDSDLVKDDLADLDADSLIHCFQILTGQAIDPKVKSESTNSSTTESAEV